MSSIGKVVKARRLSLEMSQWDLAHSSGLGQSTIASLEMGTKENVSIQTLRALARGLKCAVVDLLPDEDKHPRPRAA
jgi:transcriptional regulator with XRE-family HTH domain